MKLILIRHGETVSSRHTYAGRSDVALNEQGKTQARTIAMHLANQPIRLILCSPLSRAMDTARPLARAYDLQPVVEPLLTEFDFGVFEGCSKKDIGLVLRKAHAHTPVPGGESLMDVWNRAGGIYARLTSYDNNTSGAIAVVGHFWINRMIWGRTNGMDFDKTCRSRVYRPQTGSIWSSSSELGRNAVCRG